jgi:hypothetical protein
MVNIKVFWDVKPCLLVNSCSLYQFTRREAPDYLKVCDITVKWTATTSSLGEFVELWNITVSFMSICPLYIWKNSALSGRIFMKFHVTVFFPKSVEKIRATLKPDKNSGYFTRIPGTYFWSYLARFFLAGQKFQTKVVLESQNTTFIIFIAVPCILKPKVSHLPTDALFITL